MGYAIAFALMATALAVQAWRLGGWGWLLLWPAASFAAVTLAYGGVGPRAMGKRASGRRAWFAAAGLLPYLLFAEVVWRGRRHLTPGGRREAAAHEVAPGLWLGRRPVGPADVPAGVDLIVDLTSEFVPHRRLLAGRNYLALPTLDARSPADDAARAAVDRVAGHNGGVLIHCAQGHGRSAALLAAVLVRRGVAGDAGQAERLLHVARPGVRLTRAQRAFVRRVAEPAVD